MNRILLGGFLIVLRTIRKIYLPNNSNHSFSPIFTQQACLSNTGVSGVLLRIAHADDEQLVEFVIKHGKNRFPNPEEIVKELKYVARESYRLRPQLAESVHRILCLSLSNIRALKASLKELDDTISKQLNAFSITLTSIKGIGEVYAAGIFAKIGNINCFPSEAQIARLAGNTSSVR